MSWLLPFILSCAGFLALGLSQSKHHRALVGAMPSRIRILWLRVFGWTTLVVASGLSLDAFGVGYGLVAIAAMMNAAGIAVVLIITYAPTALKCRSSA
jgi:hypothetical protein